MQYLDPKTVTSKMCSLNVPRNPYRNGYGSKIPTAWLLQINKRWHRVYVMQYSNAGSAFILRKGERILLGSYDPQD